MKEALTLLRGSITTAPCGKNDSLIRPSTYGCSPYISQNNISSAVHVAETTWRPHLPAVGGHSQRR
jgi:hypothetical protein